MVFKLSQLDQSQTQWKKYIALSTSSSLSWYGRIHRGTITLVIWMNIELIQSYSLFVIREKPVMVTH